jgi:hypothetical protein
MWGFATQVNLGVAAVAAALAVATAAAAAGAPAGAAPPEQIGVAASAAEVTIGATVTVSGAVSVDGRPVGGEPLALQSEAYPYHGFSTVARLTSSRDGSFAFGGVSLERNSRLRVVGEGPSPASSRHLQLLVDPAVAISARRLGPGATRLSVRIRHALEEPSPPVSALWFTAASSRRLFRLAALTPTRELAPGVSYASAVVDPPAKRFAYRVCLNPPWEHAMGSPASHGPCPRHDFELPVRGR